MSMNYPGSLSSTTRYKGSVRSGGASAWFLQRLSGLVLVVLLLAHFAVLHGGDGVVTYEKVASRLATPEWKTFDLLFLVLGIFHGMNGLLMVIRDYAAPGWKRGALYAAVLVAGAVFLILGCLTVIPFQARLQ